MRLSQARPRPFHFPSAVTALVDEIVMSLLERDVNARLRTGGQLRERLCALGGELAPYPNGQLALSKAVQEALIRIPDAAELRTAPMAPHRSSSDAATLPSLTAPRSR